MKPTAAPPTTSTIGYGTDSRRARALRPATATSRPAMSSSAWPIVEAPRDVEGPAGRLGLGVEPHALVEGHGGGVLLVHVEVDAAAVPRPGSVEGSLDERAPEAGSPGLVAHEEVL